MVNVFFLQPTIDFNGFSMVPDHWSKDAMVSMDRPGLIWEQTVTDIFCVQAKEVRPEQSFDHENHVQVSNTISCQTKKSSSVLRFDPNEARHN